MSDFPPDETSLLGIGIGYAQSGLLPIVEIPYAKYLDCGADMFFEAAIYSWLSNGQQPVGMIIRLQGFDKGVFGGNFHTHNSLHIPPGVDVVCFSNGYDYVKGFRYAIQQALKGRLVMTVDSTNLLNLRHLHGTDDLWRKPFPEANQVLTFDDVMVYGDSSSAARSENTNRLALISYGNGVVTCLQAKDTLEKLKKWNNVTVIDSPYLSSCPQGLKKVISDFDHVVFADVCKSHGMPFASFVAQLQNERLLPSKWRCVGASNTYNPLGSTITFTSVEDVINAVNSFSP